MDRENFVVGFQLISSASPNALGQVQPNLTHFHNLNFAYIVHKRRRLVEDVVRVGGKILPFDD